MYELKNTSMVDIKKYFNIWRLAQKQRLTYTKARDFVNGNFMALTVEEAQLLIDAVNDSSRALCVELEDLKDKRRRYDNSERLETQRQ